MTTYDVDRQYKPIAPRMNPDVKKAWVAWLRENTERQGRDVLCKVHSGEEARFCIYGSLAELYQSTHDDAEWDDKPTEYGGYTLMYGIRMRGQERSHDTFIPKEIAEWAGIDSTGVWVNYHGRRETIMYFNDFTGVTFEEFADIIEEQL